jgi:hypothetical protein
VVTPQYLLNLWGSAEDALRVVAFLNLRRLALVCPYPFIDLCLKGRVRRRAPPWHGLHVPDSRAARVRTGIYLSFVRNAKFTSPRTLPLLTFLSNCVVEMYGLDMASSYQHAFVYIRQLAITLRSALTRRGKDAYQTVYNWQFIHSIRVWARMLGVYCRRTRPAGPPDSTSPLLPLVYPLIQVALGTARCVAHPSCLVFLRSALLMCSWVRAHFCQPAADRVLHPAAPAVPQGRHGPVPRNRPLRARRAAAPRGACEIHGPAHGGCWGLLRGFMHLSHRRFRMLMLMRACCTASHIERGGRQA